MGYTPVRKAMARTPAPSMNTRMTRSSERMSYRMHSPEAKPMPITSTAGDWARAVIGDPVAVVLRFVARKVWRQVLLDAVNE